ncbi:MAG TPA: DUF4149 domain-containing protein [Candidatus Binatia bacterium]|jgi:hypothetical protein|nr:DUF4149 domain-containing protein [Candidatus Binatia bacterium]
MGVVRFVYLLALAVWVGEIVFFSFVGAPTIFAVLERTRAGDVTSAIFPRYYALAVACGAVAVVGAFLLGRGAVRPGLWRTAVVALLLGLGATLWAARVVQPRAAALRAAMHAAPADAPVRLEFGRLHRTAVLLNAGALVAGLVALGASAGALRQ